MYLFGVNSIVKNDDEEKYVYSGYAIEFDGKGSQSFNNDFARNVIIFLIDNSSSCHTDNIQNNFSTVGKGLT